MRQREDKALPRNIKEQNNQRDRLMLSKYEKFEETGNETKMTKGELWGDAQKMAYTQ